MVSGSRGVGKTALVYKALQKVAEATPKTVCAVLNVSELEIEMGKMATTTGSSLEIRLKIIQNLIRRLYTALMDQPDAISRSDLAKLYMKAAAKESVQKEILEAEVAGRTETSRKTTRTLRSPLNIGSLLVSLFLGTWLSLYPLWPSGDGLFNILNRIVPLVVTLLGPLTFLYIRETVEERQSQTKARMQASQYYEFDGGLATLQFDLERCLDQLRESRYKVVFCIDELDKIENPELVIDIITSFKNLFNLSSAIFIVITGPEEYGLIDTARQTRGIHYTLFTNKIFVPRPSFSDLEGFLDEIVERPNVASLRQSDLYNEFRNYVCYLAASDFFDLYVVIRDFITGYEGRNPLLEIPRLDIDQTTEARLQKCLGLIYGRYQKEHVSGWAYNDALLGDLYSFISWLLSQKANFTFNDQFPDIKLEDFKEARRDFCTYLARVEALKWVGETPEHYNNYTWTGLCPPVPSRIDSRLSHEQAFVEKYDKLVAEALSITNTYLSCTGQLPFTREDLESDPSRVFGFTFKAVEADLTAIFKQQKGSYDDLHSEFPDSYPRDQLLGFAQTLDEQSKLLNTRRFLLVRNMARDTIKNATMATLQQNAAFFSTIEDIRKAVIEANIEHAVLSKEDLSKQVLMTNNLSPEVLARARTLLRRNSRVLQVVNVQTKPEWVYADMKGFKNLNLSQDIQNAPRLIQGLGKWFEM